MEGPSECLKNLNSVELEKSLGIIPRAIAFMFNKFSELEACGWTYSCSLSFMEIYNEDVFDLRSNSKSPLQISGEDFVVQGLSEIEVHNVQQAFDEFIKAKTGRRTSATAMNDVSSRSHSIFQMKLTGRNEIEGITCFGKLNLVDLAGSESHEAAKSSVQQAEGANIRKSLLALAKVMRHIHEGSSSPPFRESNLTKILKKSMLNGSKTLMVVTLANEESCKSETSRSASFAHEISRCKSTKDVPKTTIKSPRESSRVPK